MRTIADSLSEAHAEARSCPKCGRKSALRWDPDAFDMITCLWGRSTRSPCDYRAALKDTPLAFRRAFGPWAGHRGIR